VADYLNGAGLSNLKRYAGRPELMTRRILIDSRRFKKTADAGVTRVEAYTCKSPKFLRRNRNVPRGGRWPHASYSGFLDVSRTSSQLMIPGELDAREAWIGPIQNVERGARFWTFGANRRKRRTESAGITATSRKIWVP